MRHAVSNGKVSKHRLETKISRGNLKVQFADDSLQRFPFKLPSFWKGYTEIEFQIDQKRK